MSYSASRPTGLSSISVLPSGDSFDIQKADFSSGSNLEGSDVIHGAAAQPGPNSSFYVYGPTQCINHWAEHNWVQFDNELSRFKILSCEGTIISGIGPVSVIVVNGTIPSAYPIDTPVHEHDSEQPDQIAEIRGRTSG